MKNDTCPVTPNLPPFCGGIHLLISHFHWFLPDDCDWSMAIPPLGMQIPVAELTTSEIKFLASRLGLFPATHES